MMMPNLRSVAKRLGIPGRTKRARTSIGHGAAGIDAVGHRDYVGGLWAEVGRLQLDFLVERGLKPSHFLLDVGCGSLRGGVHLIPYLEPGHYLGIDKEERLIQAGIEHELGRELYDRMQPRLIVSNSFEFERFERHPEFAIAQSLFTHLPAPIIEECFRKLRPNMAPGGEFYATFFEAERAVRNPDEPHDHGYFAYTRAQMERFGTQAGWTSEYIGDWRHPRGQIMMRYQPGAAG